MYSSVIHTQWNGMQKNYSFSASFKGVSLVGSDNLLTHTFKQLNSRLFLRVRKAQFPHQKRTQASYLCLLFRTLLPTSVKENRINVHSQNTKNYD